MLGRDVSVPARDLPAGGRFQTELQVRAAEASAAAQAAELLGEDLQASIASSDLADLRSIASRNDVALDEVVLTPDPPD